VEEIDRFKKKK